MSMMLADDDLEFLESHDATIEFKPSRVYLEWRRQDGLWLQESGESVGHVINQARKRLLKWRDLEGQE